MLDIEPLEFYIEKEGLKAYIRNKAHKQVQWDGLSRPIKGLSRLRGHLAIWERKMKEVGLMDWPLDVMTSRLCTIKNYKTDLDSFSSGEVINDDVRYHAYTDGSRHGPKNQEKGYGYVVYKDERDIIVDGKQHLGETGTVFQAEVSAIADVASEMQDMNLNKVYIYSDSQAAILSLAAKTVCSHTVWDCHEKLSTLANMTEVCIKWVKAHADIPGNEAANKLAKEGASMAALGTGHFGPIS